MNRLDTPPSPHFVFLSFLTIVIFQSGREQKDFVFQDTD